MLCELGTSYGFFVLWIFMSLLGLIMMLILSSIVFYYYYMIPTYEKWVYKNNPKFPIPELVQKEIIHMCKGLSVATLCPAFSLMASKWGLSQGYCGYDNHLSTIAIPLFIQGIVIFLFTDLYEYCYHWLGHHYHFLWSIHRHHHMFYNPSPFAVIADEYIDQFVRTLPMVILPWIMPINIDLLFAIFATLFYGYGVYLHWGYETNFLTAHNPIFNTAYHHYMHHAYSVKGRPIYTGFFFKIWDQIFNSEYPNSCQCYLCRPSRNIEDWKAIHKPDYSVLLSFRWWIKNISKSTVDLKNN